MTMPLYFLKVKCVIYMGDMIKSVIKNFHLKSGEYPEYPFCPVLNCFGQNSAIFKPMMGNGKF